MLPISVLSARIYDDFIVMYCCVSVYVQVNSVDVLRFI